VSEHSLEDCVDTIALKLGAIIDERYSAEKSHELSFLDDLKEAKAFLDVSDLAKRCFYREHYALTATIRMPEQRSTDEWPFFQPFAPHPSKLRGTPTTYLNDEEAAAHYRARLSQAKVPRLIARYADLASLSTTNQERRRFARICIEQSILTFESLAAVPDKADHAASLLIRALHLARKFGLDDEFERVKNVILESARRQGGELDGLGALLLYGVADLDPSREWLPYAEFTQAAEDRAEREDAASEPFAAQKKWRGIAFGLAKVTRDQARINRTGRRYVEKLLQEARAAKDGGAPGVHVQYFLLEAWKAAQVLKDAADLKDQIRRELSACAGLLDKDLKEFTYEHEMTPDDKEAFAKARDALVGAGNRWPERAAQFLLQGSPTKEEAESVVAQSPVASLFVHQQIAKDHTVRTDGAHWYHSATRLIEDHFQSILWPHIIGPSIRRIYDAGFFTEDVLCQPFIERRIPMENLSVLADAASCLVNGHHVSASQVWTLATERLIRWGVGVLGGTTFVMDSDDKGDREAVFDTALKTYVELLAKAGLTQASKLENLVATVMTRPGYGCNWRNEVAHALKPGSEMGFQMALTAYLICVVIVLPIKIKPTE
jgi:hypothetical protein